MQSCGKDSQEQVIAAAEKEMQEVVALNSALLREQTKGEGFAEKITEYNERYRKTKARLGKLQAERDERIDRSNTINMFMGELMRRELVFEQWNMQ